MGGGAWWAVIYGVAQSRTRLKRLSSSSSSVSKASIESRVYAPYDSKDGEGNGNPLQYSCLENHMDGEAW